MITQIIDQGWGPEWSLKQFEQQILNEYLLPFRNDEKNNVIINSTWYGQELHEKTLQQLKTIAVDRIILVSMLDTAIPRKHWFSELGCEVIEVGYYAGNNYIDYWALMVNRYFTLDNYQDLASIENIDTPFMCLNRKPHWHRRRLYQDLMDHDLLDLGIVSMGGDQDHPVQRVLELEAQGTNIAPNAGTEQNGIANDIASLGPAQYWRRHFLNVVTETTWDIDQHHFVSEKIFKPIVGLRPFLVYDPTGAANWLTQRGFVPYCKDFGDITDLDLANPNNIAKFLKILSSQDKKYFQSKYLALKEKVLYNRSMFDNYVKQNIDKIKQGIQCQI